MIYVGINGLGRIGKGVFLQLANDPTICIRAINVLNILYLLSNLYIYCLLFFGADVVV